MFRFVAKVKKYRRPGKYVTFGETKPKSNLKAMKTHWSRFSGLLAVLLGLLPMEMAAKTPPLVYAVENTGVKFPKPPLPELSQLPSVEPLTDPFMWSSTDPWHWKAVKNGRSTKFSDWAKRRAEIGWEIQHYEIGIKPARPEILNASYENGVLKITMQHEGRGMEMTAKVILPEGKGPFPAVIGMNSGSGSLPGSLFSDRGIARITFSHNQVTTYYKHSNQDPYYQFYPELNCDNTGQYSAWAWGVSRIIDGLEQCQRTLPIDLKHLAVTGCSYAGKMALIAGAFDERIALTIAQESGGGGVASWRVSQTLGKVENLGATNYDWFSNAMLAFKDQNVSRLPMDHHELCAMIAPRALLVYGNPDYAWLADESGYVSIQAAREVWKTFGIEDRCGFTIVGGHGHCQLPTDQQPELIAFIEKFLLGNTTVKTLQTKSQFTNVDYQRWFKWWGTDVPTLAPASH
jgi:hypothetical protein